MTLIEQYQDPILVTVLYLCMYYGFMLVGLRVRLAKFREHKARGEKFDRYFSQDRELLASDRLQLNTLEHMPPFLWAMWLHAVFVSPRSAAGAGLVYLVTRLTYPFLLGKALGRGIKGRVFIATFAGYGVLVYLLGGVLVQLFR